MNGYEVPVANDSSLIPVAPPINTNHEGFMLMEILVALVLMAIAIIPMLDAFARSFLSSNVQQESAVFSNQARWTLFRS
jgi:Tfp pilus assembly protein PilV